MLPKVVTLDFETHAIQGRPNYPPEPVGLAFKAPGVQSGYLRWGHAEGGNNCTKQDAYDLLANIWDDEQYGLLFHHAKFDLAVAHEKLHLPMPAPLRVHDTMFLAYLTDPHAKRNGLKELAEDILGVPPEEQDAVAEWIWKHRKMLVDKYGGKITRAKKGQYGAGAWLWAAPGDVVEPYAIGDVDRTYGIFKPLYEYVERRGMLEAYDRERLLLPILMENERVGLRIDMERLAADIETYTEAMERCEHWLRKRLRASGLNFNDDVAIATAFKDRGIVREEDWVATKSGQLSVSKENLKPEHYTDPQVFQAFGYRNRLETCLKMFMLPWYEQAERRGDGYISTTWNQTRGAEKAGGTRTGRPSTTDPNLLNISKSFADRPDGYTHPAFLEIPELPLVRKYVLPDDGHVFCHRDFDGQELRVFGHFESGKLQAEYLKNPAIDVHQMVADDIQKLLPGTPLDRTKTKIINFRTIYGSGIAGLAKALDCAYNEAKTFKGIHAKALPGMKILNDLIKELADEGLPIVTWGGREYYPEEPVWSEKFGRMMDFVYKLLNYLIQGSAADLTKQAIIDWHAVRDPASRFLVTVYDEINISVPFDKVAREMRVLRESMQKDRLSVPMLSSGKWGWSWGDVVKPGKGEDEDVALARWLDEQRRAA